MSFPNKNNAANNIDQNKTIRLAVSAAFALAALLPLQSSAQTVQTSHDGYWVTNTDMLWKSGTGLCWRSGSWTPANAIAECEPGLMKVAAAPAEQIAQAPIAPMPAQPMVTSRKVSFSAEELFAFDKSELRPAGRASLDKLIADIKDIQDQKITVTGHTDRIGKPAYNMRLSQRRASAVADYLTSHGIAANRITATGLGETTQITKAGECKGPLNKALIACLQPDRRVDVEVSGVTTESPAAR